MKDLINKADDVSRRDFVLRTAQTLLGLGVMPMAANFGLPQLAQAAPARAAGAAGSGPINVIYLYMGGGMSHLDTFDPKPNNPDVAGPVKAINTSADNVRISEYLPQLAQHMDKCAIVRSLSSTQGAHSQGSYFMHTSYQQLGTISHPALGAWILKMQGKSNETLPGNVFIGGGSGDSGAGFFEATYAPLVVGNPVEGLQNSHRPDDVTDKQFLHRLEMAADFDRGFQNRYDQRLVRAYGEMYDDALRLMRSEDLKAFDISQESGSTRARYGETNFGQGCLLARRLVEHNVRFVEVSGPGSWDTHIDNFDAVQSLAATLDQGLSALMEDLSTRGLLERTVVVLATEFGRTPQINVNNGRDHFPKAFSGLIAGGPIKGGQAYGQTNEMGTEVAENLVTVPDFNATIAKAVGLDVDKVLHSPSGRPFQVAHDGKPIETLLS